MLLQKRHQGLGRCHEDVKKFRNAHPVFFCDIDPKMEHTTRTDSVWQSKRFKKRGWNGDNLVETGQTQKSLRSPTLLGSASMLSLNSAWTVFPAQHHDRDHDQEKLEHFVRRRRNPGSCDFPLFLRTLLSTTIFRSSSDKFCTFA